MTNAILLIVEDDGILAANLESIIRGLGYEVLKPLGSGEEALALLQEHPADLVLMDIELAGDLNGIETAAARIRPSSFSPDTPTTRCSNRPMSPCPMVT